MVEVRGLEGCKELGVSELYFIQSIEPGTLGIAQPSLTAGPSFIFLEYAHCYLRSNEAEGAFWYIMCILALICLSCRTHIPNRG